MSFNVYLDSRDSRRTGSGTRTNQSWTWDNLNLTLANTVSYSVRMESIAFMNGVFPVEEGTITFQEDGDTGTTYTATIPAGFYIRGQFVNEVADQMTAVSGNTFTYEGTLTNSYQSDIAETAAEIFRFTGGTLLKRLGYDPSGADLNTTFASEQVSTYGVNVQGTAIVNVLTDMALANVSSSGFRGLLHQVPCPEYGASIYYEDATASELLISDDTFSSITVQLLKDDNSAFILPPGYEIQMVLRFVPAY